MPKPSVITNPLTTLFTVYTLYPNVDISHFIYIKYVRIIFFVRIESAYADAVREGGEPQPPHSLRSKDFAL